MATSAPKANSSRRAIYEDSKVRTLGDAEVDGTWFLLSDEDRAEFEAMGWKDGKPPEPLQKTPPDEGQP